jgi:hypothetical protein
LTVRLIEEELVVHYFAPMDGHTAQRAYERLRGVWRHCETALGMDQPILATSLPDHLPAAPGELGAGPTLAGRENRASDFQVIARREHDLLNLSLVLANPADGDGPGGARRSGAAARPGWAEFDRWLGQAVGDGADDLVGVARVYQAKVAEREHLDRSSLAELGDAVRSALPPRDDEPQWWDWGIITADGFAVWEASTRRDTRSERRLVVLAPASADARLSAWTWSRGDVALPPFARYLMHAAKLRYELRQWAGGSSVTALHDRLEKATATVGRALAEPPGAGLADAMAQLHQARADVVGALSWIRALRLTAQIASENLAAGLASAERAEGGSDPLSEDATLGPWFVQALSDAAGYIEIAEETAEHLAGVAQAELARRQAQPARPEVRARGGSAAKMGFAIDAVGYSNRNDAAKRDVQHRISTMVDDLLEDLRLRLSDTDHHGTGDGMIVFLPGDADLGRAMNRLIRGAAEWLARDNRRFTDRLRLRMALSFGPIEPAAIGFTGNTIVECGRLVDSQPLRSALMANEAADLCVLVSNTLYRFVVGNGFPGLEAAEFVRIDDEIRNCESPAWLWLSSVDGGGVTARGG